MGNVFVLRSLRFKIPKRSRREIMTLRPKVATPSKSAIKRADPRTRSIPSQTTLWQSIPLLFRLRLVPYVLEKLGKQDPECQEENLSKEKNQYQTQRTCDAASGNRTIWARFHTPQIVNIVALIAQINRLFYDCTACKTGVIFCLFSDERKEAHNKRAERVTHDGKGCLSCRAWLGGQCSTRASLHSPANYTHNKKSRLFCGIGVDCDD